MSTAKQYALIIGGLGALGDALEPKLKNAGFEVLLADKRLPPNGHPNYFHVDATCAESFQKLEKDLEVEGIQLSHVINCVGVRVETGLTSLFETSAQEIKDTLSLNLESQIYALRYLGKHVMNTDSSNKSFTIISSVNAHHAYSVPVYSAAKAGLHGLIPPVAMELGVGGVRVNIVTPGSIRTPVTEREPKDFTAREQAAALKRLATYDEVADGIMASVTLTGMTGQQIVIDAGQSINPSESLFDQHRKMIKPAP